MPVPRPPAPTGAVQLPPVPSDPPTLQDVSSAINYSTRIKIDNETRMPGTATNDDVARAAVYETNIMVVHGAGAAAPAWFGPAIGNALDQALTPIKRTVAKSFNLQCYDGASRPFEIVPFLNGQLPNVPPHNLPPLINVGAIQALSVADSIAYVNGYGLGAIPVLADRKGVIGREIGCTVEI